MLENQLPTAVTSEAEKARTPARTPPLAPAGSGTACFDQDDSFQARTSGRLALPTPTAHACDDEMAAIPSSWRPGVEAVGDTCQLVPFVCSIRLVGWATWSRV